MQQIKEKAQFLCFKIDTVLWMKKNDIKSKQQFKLDNQCTFVQLRKEEKRDVES